MNTQEIVVTYQWITEAQNAEQLKAIYKDVTEAMQANEPDAQRVGCYYDDKSNTLTVIDHFKNAAALGLHLGTTAPAHFPQLLQIAQPGPFLFCGSVPQEMQEAALGMGLNASFSPYVFGFERELVG
jgi:quinol monooxygenase YgiN